MASKSFPSSPASPATLSDTNAFRADAWTEPASGPVAPAPPPYSRMDPHAPSLLGAKSRLPLTQVTPEARSRFEKIFRQNNKDKPYLTSIEAATVFLQTGLSKADLSRIWEQADADQNGRFSLDEFIHAMWLVELQIRRNESGLDLVPTLRPSSASSTAPFSQPKDPEDPPGKLVRPKLSKAVVCKSCEVGVLPEEFIFHRQKCPKGGLGFCEPCYSPDKACEHGLRRINLGQVAKLRSLASGVKCHKCKTKMKGKDFCFQCDSCWDPDLCAQCWRLKDRRCKHAAKGKVKMCRVSKKDGIDEIIEIVGEMAAAFVGC